MRAWLVRAPWWVLGLVTGVTFGLFVTLDNRVREDEPWTQALVVGLLGGVFFGVFMGPFIARTNRRYRETAGEEHVDRLTRLGRRGWRTKLGDDPELRAAARRVALLQRDQLLRQRPWAVPVFLLFIALDVWLALTRSPWWLLAGAVPAAILLSNLRMPRRLERRAEELRDPASDPP